MHLVVLIRPSHFRRPASLHACMRTVVFSSPSNSYKSSPAKTGLRPNSLPHHRAFNVLAAIFVGRIPSFSRRNLTASKIGNLGYEIHIDPLDVWYY
jgi:hypothetical protein